MPLNKIREYIFENPTQKVHTTTEKAEINANEKEKREIYIRENVCDIFEMHYSEENAEKYKHIIENVKKYVKEKKKK